MEKKTYDYDWYQKNSGEYRKLYKQDFDLKNKYFLLAIGGTLVILIPLLETFGDVIKILILIEVSLLIVLGFLILYSFLKEVEVNEKFIENYDEAYDKHGEEEVTDERAKKINEILYNNKFYDEAIKNEKNIKKFFKIIIIYTIFLLFSIILREREKVFDKMIKEKVETEIKIYGEALKPPRTRKGIKEEAKENEELESKKIYREIEN